MRGTTALDVLIIDDPYFSIRVPREGHDSFIVVKNVAIAFSIRVPREGHDSKNA